jgi:hypothetical protein
MVVKRIAWTDLLLKAASRGIESRAFLRPLIFADEEHRRRKLWTMVKIATHTHAPIIYEIGSCCTYIGSCSR